MVILTLLLKALAAFVGFRVLVIFLVGTNVLLNEFVGRAPVILVPMGVVLLGVMASAAASWVVPIYYLICIVAALAGVDPNLWEL